MFFFVLLFVFLNKQSEFILIIGEKNVEDRNRDFHTINDNLNFRGKKLKDHEYVPSSYFTFFIAFVSK